MIHIPTPLLAALLCLSTASLPAQLSGTYTLDPQGSGTRNFKSFTEAVFYLVTQGVSGAVTVDIAPGSYRENIYVYPIPGAGPNRRVTFRSKQRGAARLTPVSSNRILFRVYSSSVGRISGVHFQGLAFGTPTSTHSTSCLLSGDDLSLTHCDMYHTYVFIEGDRNELGHCSISNIGDVIECEGDGHHIHHCSIRGLRSGSEILKIRGAGVGAAKTRIYNNVIHSDVTTYSTLEFGVEFFHNTVVQLPDPNQTSTASLLAVRSSYINYPEIRNNVFANLHGGSLMTVWGTISPFHVRASHNAWWVVKPGTLLFSGPSSTPKIQATSLSSWQQQTGLEANSVFADPSFGDVSAAPLGLKLSPTTKVAKLASTPPAYVTDDYEGKPRSAPFTAGAFIAPRISTWVPYGQGCPGSGNIVPQIAYSGALAPGSQNFEIQLKNALGGFTVQGLLAVGLQKTQFNLGGSCNLLLNPINILQTNVAGTGAGTGTAGFKIPLPNNSNLFGIPVHFQWAVADPAAAGMKLATSGAATLTL